MFGIFYMYKNEANIGTLFAETVHAHFKEILEAYTQLCVMPFELCLFPLVIFVL